jgi:flagellar biosynthesis/type III secretory pathway protein FliH
LQQQGTPQKTKDGGHFEVYRYPPGPKGDSVPTWESWNGPEGSASTASEPAPVDTVRLAVEAELRAGFEKRIGEESRKSFAAGQEKGRQEGRQAEREGLAGAQAAAAEQRKLQAAQLVEAFVQARDRFLAAVEREVVELALAVASRILRREAQMDPLLLTAAVRVALGQLSSSTEVKLLVPPADRAMWSEALTLIPNLSIKPQVLAGESMRLGDCVVETALGSVDLGIRSQLGEIERGFFDRLGGTKAKGPEARRMEASIDGAADADRGARS